MSEVNLALTPMIYPGSFHGAHVHNCEIIALNTVSVKLMFILIGNQTWMVTELAMTENDQKYIIENNFCSRLLLKMK